MPPIDPFARLDRLIADPLAAASTAARPASMLPRLSEEEEENLLETLGRQTVSGLSHAAHILDMPGGIVRNTLMGQNPFQGVFYDWHERPTGRDMLRQWGVLSPYGQDTWGNFVGGLAAEILTDPFVSVSGPGRALNWLGKAAQRLGRTPQGLKQAAVKKFKLPDESWIQPQHYKALTEADVHEAPHQIFGITPARRMQEAEEGARALLSLHLPFMPGGPSVTLGGGKAASAAINAFNYAPFISAPTRAMRQSLGHNPFITKAGGFSAEGQRIADVEFAKLADFKADAIRKVGDIKAQLPELKQAFERSIVRTVNDVPELYERYFGRQLSRNADDAIDFDEFARAMGEHRDLGAKMGIAEGEPGFGKVNLLGDRIVDLEQSIRAAGLNFDEVLDAGRKMDEYVGEVVDLSSSLRQDLVDRGLDLKMLDDDFISHVPRRLTHALREGYSEADLAAMAKTFPKGRRKAFVQKYRKQLRHFTTHMLGRENYLRNIPGGTAALNKIAKDPAVTATYMLDAKPKLSDRMRHLENVYGVDPAISRSMAEQMSRMPSATLDHGLFGNEVLEDMIEYAVSMVESKAATDAVYDLMLHAADVPDAGPGVIGPTVDTVLKDVGLDVNKGQNAAKWFNDLSAAKFPGQNFTADTVAVPQELANMATKYLKAFQRPDETASAILKMYDQIQGYFKAGVTLPFPGFHSRNTISGLWQNWVSAFRTVGHGMKSYKLAWDGLNPNASGEAAQYFDEVLEYGTFRDANRMRSIAHGTSIADVHRTLHEQAGIVTNPFRGLVGTVQPVKHALGTARESAAASRALGGGMLRQAGAGTLGFGKGMLDVGAARMELVEYINRMSHYIAKRTDGWSPAMANRSVLLNHFDYPSILKHGSGFEKNFLRRIVPFFAWSRFNVPRQVYELINSPGGRTAQTVRTINRMQEDAAGDESGFLPSWLQERVTLPVSGPLQQMLGSPQGPEAEHTKRLLSFSGFLPIEDALNRVVFQGGMPNVSRTGQKMVAMTNPLLQYGMYELPSGQQAWTGRRLSEAHQWPLPDEFQTTNELVARSPFARFSTMARQLQDERKTAAAKLFNFMLGGANVTDLDLQTARRHEARRLIEDLMGSQAATGFFERMYVRPEELDELTPEQLEMLSLYQAMLRPQK